MFTNATDHVTSTPKQLRAKLWLLLLIFVLGFSLQAGLYVSYMSYSNALDKQIANAEVQGILGNDLNHNVNSMQMQFYELTVANNVKHRESILKKIDDEIAKIHHLVALLEKGGDFTHVISLNLPDKDDLSLALSYNPIQNSQYNILRIDLIPKLKSIRLKAQEISDSLSLMYDLIDEEAKSDLLAQRIQQNKMLLKQSVPMFDRLQENTNRVVYEQVQYLQTLKAQVKAEKHQYLLRYIGLSLMVIVLGLMFFYWISQHIQQMAQELDVEKDRALQATESKSNFLANMSHEIRTPLNAIVGFIQLLRAKETDPEKMTYLKTIEQSSHGLVAIINDILDFSKIESNKLDLDKVDFETFEAFNSTAELFKAHASQKNITLEVDIAANLPPVLHSDSLRLKQIMNNLLSNAIKFTEPGKTVFLNISYPQDKQLKIEVIDQGIGISPDQQSKIFEAFSQAEASTTRKYGGTGLGLAICARLVEMLGGQLKVESEVGKGSCFYFEIPIDIGQPIAQVQAPMAAPETFHGHLLLVEDNKTNQLLMSAILRKLKLTFDIANDGVEAIDAVQQQQYDLILMDENMPNMNGIVASGHIRQYEQQNHLKHTPIIALTANAMKGDRERFLAAGMDEYLSKPLNIALLKQHLSTFLAPAPENV
ncbi:ATP-binding protein [Thiosulfativibrio zosterae]|uniref:histidine kinase n=1 Tax=Thiosulfativibrio zosterae TaxID=2675053 RepID=A0A6F8PR18_9GAMM|nr:ATP-binding protein [Thiosulfativibrio zosterae]BBP44573.1 hypothetical protein THMIRHAT_23190 [Thiosulfativibrio zosterae]